MSVWRYSAIPIADRRGTSRGTAQRAGVHGEIDAESAADARARLRSAGLRAVSLEQASRGTSLAWLTGNPLVLDHLLRRRTTQKAELLDALATMLESGIVLVESLGSVSAGSGDRPRRALARRLRAALESGRSLSEACRDEPGWFDEAEAAQLAAGEFAGTLPGTLRAMAGRLEHADELTAKIFGALAYPAIVSVVGLGVVVFLGTNTLPTLVQTLEDAGVTAPPLTLAVISVGQGVSTALPFAVPALGLALIFALVVAAWRAAHPAPSQDTSSHRSRRVPRLWKRVRTADCCDRIADLLRSGVPSVEALRTLAPSFRSPMSRPLGDALGRIAASVSAGSTLADGFADEPWFDAEFARMVAAGETAGNLDAVLNRLAARYRRDARRRIDRLTAVLEPAVILALAAVIGVVVIAAVLPLTQLREVL